ncbi:MAG: hypothetical protein WCB04_07395 [Mycobacteriales bacterium]
MGSAAPSHNRILLELGRTWVFASAVDWPGWCRRGKGEHAAIDALLDYQDRYALIAGRPFRPGEPRVVDRVPGNATTDFGAPDARSRFDDDPLESAEAGRLADLLIACWERFDEVAAASPAELRKGPRGGGRDRDAVVDHVREAERSYGRKLGVRVPPRTPWAEQRAAISAAIRTPPGQTAWPVRYLVRRTAWHVLDHAWEIEDKSAG